MTIHEVSEFLGAGPSEIREGMRRASTDDPLLGACYMYAAGCAVNIKGDREAWNMSYAKIRRDELYSKFEENKA